jgi:mRNA interferase HigB
MRIVGRDRIKQAEDDHPGSGIDNALAGWVTIVEGAQWRHFPDVKATFGKRVDPVDGYVVFDIKGNDFRLTSIINYQVKTVLVVRIRTHAEYTRKGA